MLLEFWRQKESLKTLRLKREILEFLGREKERYGFGRVFGVNCDVPPCGELSLFIGKKSY